MPVLSFPKLPESVDPAKASDDDALYQTLLRKAASALGLDDPVGAAMGMVSPMPAVTMFPVTGTKLANEAARKAGNTAYEAAIKNMPRNLRRGFEAFAQRYPRVAAHMEPGFGKSTSGNKRVEAFTSVPGTKVTEPVPVGITRYGRFMTSRFMPGGAKRAKNLIGHEGTHVAQALGNQDLGTLYDAAETLYGYKNNPFEVTARRAGLRTEDPLSTALEGTYDNAINVLRRHLYQLESARGGANPVKLNKAQDKAARQIRNILLGRDEIAGTAKGGDIVQQLLDGL
jgi:hypothetical protein